VLRNTGSTQPGRRSIQDCSPGLNASRFQPDCLPYAHNFTHRLRSSSSRWNSAKLCKGAPEGSSDRSSLQEKLEHGHQPPSRARASSRRSRCGRSEDLASQSVRFRSRRNTGSTQPEKRSVRDCSPAADIQPGSARPLLAGCSRRPARYQLAVGQADGKLRSSHLGVTSTQAGLSEFLLGPSQQV
jgi:hypothetical protein